MSFRAFFLLISKRECDRLLPLRSQDCPLAISRGGLHLEWKVAPPSMSNAAMPEAAMASAMAPWDLT